MCDVLLIEPPYNRIIGETRFWLPVGLLALANQLNRAGIVARIYNGDATVGHSSERALTYAARFYDSDRLLDPTDGTLDEVMSEMALVLETERPRVVGISVKSDSVPSALRLIRYVRKQAPDARLLVGGPHFSPVDRSFLPLVDMICVGDFDDLIVEAARRLLHSPKPDQAEIWFGPRNPNYPVDPPERLDTSCVVAAQAPGLAKMSKLMVASSRGCPYRCSFCYMGSNHDKVRYASGASVARYMLNNFESLGILKYYFVDDTFGTSIDQLRCFRTELGESVGRFRWSCMTHAKVSTQKRLDLLADLGCAAIHLGVESGSQQVLDRLNKNVTPKELAACAGRIHGAGIDLRTFVMIGIPGESQDDLRRTKELLMAMTPSEIAVQVYVPYRGTVMETELRARGILSDIAWDRFAKCYLNKGVVQVTANDDPSIRDFFTFADEWNAQHMR